MTGSSRGLLSALSTSSADAKGDPLSHSPSSGLDGVATPNPPRSRAIRRGGLRSFPAQAVIAVDLSESEERSDNAAGGDVVASIDAFLELLAEIAIEATARRPEVTQSAA